MGVYTGGDGLETSDGLVPPEELFRGGNLGGRDGFDLEITWPVLCPLPVSDSPRPRDWKGGGCKAFIGDDLRVGRGGLTCRVDPPEGSVALAGWLCDS